MERLVSVIPPFLEQLHILPTPPFLSEKSDPSPLFWKYFENSNPLHPSPFYKGIPTMCFHFIKSSNYVFSLLRYILSFLERQYSLNLRLFQTVHFQNFHNETGVSSCSCYLFVLTSLLGIIAVRGF